MADSNTQAYQATYEANEDTFIVDPDPAGRYSSTEHFLFPLTRIPASEVPWDPSAELDEGESGGLICAICTTVFNETDTIPAVLGCNHVFCISCICQWIGLNWENGNGNQCPTCREEFFSRRRQEGFVVQPTEQTPIVANIQVGPDALAIDYPVWDDVIPDRANIHEWLGDDVSPLLRRIRALVDNNVTDIMRDVWVNQLRAHPMTSFMQEYSDLDEEAQEAFADLSTYVEHSTDVIPWVIHSFIFQLLHRRVDGVVDVFRHDPDILGRELNVVLDALYNTPTSFMTIRDLQRKMVGYYRLPMPDRARLSRTSDPEERQSIMDDYDAQADAWSLLDDALSEAALVFLSRQ